MRWGEPPWSSRSPCAGAAERCPRFENCAAGACLLALLPQGTLQGRARRRWWCHPRAGDRGQSKVLAPVPPQPGLGDDGGCVGGEGTRLPPGRAGGAGVAARRGRGGQVPQPIGHESCVLGGAQHVWPSLQWLG